VPTARARILVASLPLLAGTLRAAPGKGPPADAGPGRRAGLDPTPTDLRRSRELGGTIAPGFRFPPSGGTGAVAPFVDPAGHPAGPDSRTPPAPRWAAAPAGSGGDR
jgi:hypothetical protein